MTKHVPIKPPTGTEVWSDEFDNATIGSHWSRIDTCTASHGDWKEGYGWIGFKHTNLGSGSPNTGHWLVTDLPAGATHPFTVEYYVRMLSNRTQTYSMQLSAYSTSNTGGSGTQHMMMGHSSPGANADITGNRHWTGWNAQTAFTNLGQYVRQDAGYYLRQYWWAANTFRMQVSTDGINWIGSGDYSITMTPAYFGIGLSNYNTTTAFVASYYYVRMYDTLTPDRAEDTI